MQELHVKYNILKYIFNFCKYLPTCDEALASLVTPMLMPFHNDYAHIYTIQKTSYLKWLTGYQQKSCKMLCWELQNNSHLAYLITVLISHHHTNNQLD